MPLFFDVVKQLGFRNEWLIANVTFERISFTGFFLFGFFHLLKLCLPQFLLPLVVLLFTFWRLLFGRNFFLGFFFWGNGLLRLLLLIFYLYFILSFVISVVEKSTHKLILIITLALRFVNFFLLHLFFHLLHFGGGFFFYFLLIFTLLLLIRLIFILFLFVPLFRSRLLLNFLFLRWFFRFFIHLLSFL